MSRVRTRLEALERERSHEDEDWSGLRWVLTEAEWNALPEDVQARYHRAPYIPLIIVKRPGGEA